MAIEHKILHMPEQHATSLETLLDEAAKDGYTVSHFAISPGARYAALLVRETQEAKAK